MKLSKPEDDPNEAVEEDAPSVDSDEVEELRESLDDLTERLDYAETLAEQNAGLWDTIDELEERLDEVTADLETVRADVGGLYKRLDTDRQGRHVAVANDGKSAWAPGSVDPYDPTDEGE
jgi:tetrahydromethanopterin S-methyltransferase subunit G